MKKGLTVKQQAVFDAIVRLTEELGCPPTRIELANEMKFKSVNGVVDHLIVLQRKGKVELKKHVSRGIILAGDTLSVSELNASYQRLANSAVALVGKIVADYSQDGVSLAVPKGMRLADSLYLGKDGVTKINGNVTPFDKVIDEVGFASFLRLIDSIDKYYKKKQQ